MHTDSISNSVIMNNNYVLLLSLFVHMRTNEEIGVANEVIVLKWLVLSTLWDYKVVKKWWNHEEEEQQQQQQQQQQQRQQQQQQHFGCLATFWFGTFVMIFRATMNLVGHENTQRWMVCCYTGL